MFQDDDQKKHDEFLDQAKPDVVDESDAEGSASEPSGYNTLDEAHEMGLYKEADDEHPAELGIAEQVKIDELEHLEED